MLPPLSSPGFRERALPLSVETWHWLVERGLAPARAELLRGLIVEKMSKSPLHTKLVARLLKALEAALGDRFWVRKEEPLTLADSEPEPDLAVVPGREADYAAHPTTALLVVEVSVASLTEDRELAALYAEAGVAEYWIVNARAHTIEVFSHPEHGSYHSHAVVAPDATVACASLPQFQLSLADLFDGLQRVP